AFTQRGIVARIDVHPRIPLRRTTLKERPSALVLAGFGATRGQAFLVPVVDGRRVRRGGGTQCVGRALVERDPHACFAAPELRAQAAIELTFGHAAIAARLTAQILRIAGLDFVPAFTIAVTLLAFRS